jgi:hypothetical protein
MPISVLTKSALGAQLVAGDGLGAIANHVARSLLLSLREPLAFCLVAGVGLCFGRALPVRPARGGGRGPELAVAGFAGLAVLGHLLAGRFGWLSRYEPYIVLTVLLAALYCLRQPLRRHAPWRRIEAAYAAVALAVPLATYAGALARTPLAANNVYEMTYSVHRFLVEHFHRPVAVNDLGWASYRNDAYVLDIFGLGHDDARRQWLSGRMTTWLDEITEAKAIDLAVVYEGWYGETVPADWTKVAVLRLSRRLVSPAEESVHFYVTRPAAVAEIAAALCRFAPTLPPEPLLTVLPGCPAAPGVKAFAGSPAA